tara:strand:+ start:364 stop:666 length:303 start_codon:yes stop_codon:yes gene_type:complete
MNILKRHVKDRELAQYVNDIDGVTCRLRTEEEEEAYMEALPEFIPYVDPLSLLPISKNVVKNITARMRQEGCTRAMACHDYKATVGQYLKALKRIKEEGK